MNKNHKNNNAYILYTVAFAICGAIIFSSVALRGNSLVQNGDGLNEYYPILIYISKYIRSFIPNLLSGNLPMFDASIGFGDDVIGTLNWFGFGDVFTLLSALFPERYMAFGYSTIVIVRMYFSGIFFIYYCKYRGLETKSSILGALTYVYSFYTLGKGLIAFTFTIPLTWFPLIIYGIDETLFTCKHSKQFNHLNPILLVTIFFISLTGFYYLYMMILAGVFYYLVQAVDLIYEKTIDIGKAIQRFFLIALHFALGMGLGCIILFPVVLFYFQCMREGDSSFSIFQLLSLFDKYTLQLLIRDFITPPVSGYWNGGGFSLIAVISVILPVFQRKSIGKKIWKRILFIVIAAFGYFFPTVGYIMNGFAYSTDRWMFILSFFMAYIVASSLQEIQNSFSKIYFILCNIGLLITGVLFIRLTDSMTKGKIFELLVYELLWEATLIVLYKRDIIGNGQRWIYLLGTANIALTGFMFFGPAFLGGSGVGASFYSQTEINEILYNGKIAEAASGDGTEALSRHDFNDGPLDSPIIFSTKTTFSYYSMCNGYIFNIFDKMRISPAIKQTFIIQGLDGRQNLETLLSVKDYEIDSDQHEVVSNSYPLQIGTTFDSIISEKEAEKLTELERQNLLMSSLIIDKKSDNNVNTVDLGEQNEVPINIEYSSDIKTSGSILTVSKGSQIHITFDPVKIDEPGTELYLEFENLTADPDFVADIDVSGKSIRCISKESEWYYHNDFDYLVQVNKCAKSGIIDITFQNSEKFTLNGLRLIENKQYNFENNYNNLKRESLNDARWINTNTLCGNITLEKDKWMFICLPYSNGWKCYVDGAEIPIEVADYSFMAVKIPPGTHTITMHYITPGLFTGLYISISSFIIIILLMHLNFKCSRKTLLVKHNLK